MLTFTRQREREANALQDPTAPIPAPVPDPIAQRETIRQLQVENRKLREQIVAAEQRASDAERKLEASEAELLKRIEEEQTKPRRKSRG